MAVPTTANDKMNYQERKEAYLIRVIDLMRVQPTRRRHRGNLIRRVNINAQKELEIARDPVDKHT